MRRHDDDGPILITEAAPSLDEEFAARKKRYSIIMALRIPCLILAGVFGVGFNLPLVAVAFIILSVPLPWVAVLIANDRAPKKSEKANRYRRSAREVEAVSDRRIIEAAEVLEARDPRAHRTPQDDPDDPDRSPPVPRTGSDG